MNILGVDIGGTNVKLGIVTEKGGIIEHGLLPTPAGGPEAAAAKVAEWYGGRRKHHGDARAAGIACAGLIDGVRGFLYTSPNLPGWDNAPLGEIFGRRLGIPVAVDNDVNCAVWGEYVMGAGRGTRHFVAVTLGTGVGGGIVIDGRLYHGAQGLAGEIGHHVIIEGGPPCSCGGRGCLEALIGSASIAARAVETAARTPGSRLALGAGLTVREIHEAALLGDAAAVETLAETGRLLGIGLANVVHILNPEAIAVGGGVAGAGDFILEPARKSMKEHLIGDILSAVRIVPAELGNMASFLGASMLALEKQ
ncbi:MAG: ROK family protein [Candidatus Krumholzibacteria bacterium]|jgi:glucokinase|nr:ROK family protein [Candidatus Krumholzibacteria bacterium]